MKRGGEEKKCFPTQGKGGESSNTIPGKRGSALIFRLGYLDLGKKEGRGGST